ncbi:MAG: hypothetical protein ACREGR_02480 [Minisyncoccia bacterium]
MPASTNTLIIPFFKSYWDYHGLDGIASLFGPAAWSGPVLLVGKGVPSRLPAYIGNCTVHDHDPDVKTVVKVALDNAKDGVVAVMDLACYALSPLSTILSQAEAKLVCGTGPDPLPSIRTRLQDHGMPDELFRLNVSKIHLVLRGILSKYGRRLSSAFMAGSGRVWESLSSFARLCEDSRVCDLGGNSWDALVNLYAHSMPWNVQILSRYVFAQVDDSWATTNLPRVAIAQRVSHRGLRFRDIDPILFASEKSRYDRHPTGVIGRPIMRPSRIAHKAAAR